MLMNTMIIPTHCDNNEVIEKIKTNTKVAKAS